MNPPADDPADTPVIIQCPHCGTMDRASGGDRGSMMTCFSCRRSFEIEEFRADGGDYAGSIWDQPDRPSHADAGTWPVWTVALFLFIALVSSLLMVGPMIVPAFGAIAVFVQGFAAITLLLAVLYLVLTLVGGRRKP